MTVVPAMLLLGVCYDPAFVILSPFVCFPLALGVNSFVLFLLALVKNMGKRKRISTEDVQGYVHYD